MQMFAVLGNVADPELCDLGDELDILLLVNGAQDC